ncbi:MAG TPA: glycerol-3-phosphate 1-O-acyltransferase PlsY [Oscillatoriaceae cyanobacterium M33_DOE_052]|uniref:Glycerol-3-phosphate acyltransferase n=1 Tax=Planktothricoides sp. SpSt-374 TaxID=2282167 RepID=A0A7C3VRQ2_9CYAN|nr:glycerol-3-phosphate 1-O-acyltransferase PlsY [Oscillatoriaceae cyanobacterium M33_DOE_052]
MLIWLVVNLSLLLGAYVLGSIPTGYAAGRLLKGIDIRQEGSGSTGATNVLRTLGKGPAVMVLLVDVLKGVGAVALVNWAYYLEFTSTLASPPILLGWLPWMVTGAALAAVLGHSKSVWLGFTGGKSVATSLGVLLAMSWPVGLAALGVFGVFIGVSRIVSLSSIAAAMAVPLIFFATHSPTPYLLFGFAGGIYVIWRHRSNITRIMAGTEPKVGEKLPSSPEADSAA